MNIKKQPRVKGQALALVLVMVVIAVVVVIAVTSRVTTDIQQQALERASTRAETIAESAIDKVTQQIQKGEISLRTGTQKYSIGDQTQGTVGSLGLCTENTTDLSKKCASESEVSIIPYNKIIKFKINNGENLEAHLFPENAALRYTAGASEIIASVSDNDSFADNQSALLVRGFAVLNDPTSGKLTTRLVGECVWSIRGTSQNTVNCTPGDMFRGVALDSCPDINRYGTKCMSFRATPASGGVTFYRVKAVLKGKNNHPNPNVEVSLLSSVVTADPKTSYDLPVPQMVFVRAAVYTGESGGAQSIFQESDRIILVRPIVPEAFDYVLFNGSGETLEK
jgi:Tfp pilus assembly protein PilX